MKKFAFSLFFLATVISSFGHGKDQPSLFTTCDICLSGTSFCNTTFNLEQGNTYTFTTTAITGGAYRWSVIGPISIVGSPTGSSVQVQASSTGTGYICLTKKAPGEDPCCICYPVVVTAPCPTLGSYFITNSINTDPNWCSDAAGNFLDFNWLSGSGTATVTFRDMNFNIVMQYFNASGNTLGWPNGVPLSNQNPPPAGGYFVLIENDCKADAIGGYFEVVSCNFGRNVPKFPMEDLKVDLYPNPASGEKVTVNISGVPDELKKTNPKLVFRLVDAGMTRQAGTWTIDSASEQFSFSTSGMQKGVYLLIANIGGRHISKKLVVQ